MGEVAGGVGDGGDMVSGVMPKYLESLPLLRQMSGSEQGQDVQRGRQPVVNRHSPWADVWSWLPHEGKLLIQNKGMRQLTVRMPGWARRAEMRCQVNGRDAEPRWSGGRMIFEGLQGAETVLITTPVNTDSGVYTMVNLADPQHSQEQYRCEFRGHTAVGVHRLAAGNDPHDHDWYRLFRREAMTTAAVPMKSAPAYVHPAKLIDWLMLASTSTSTSSTSTQGE